MVGSNPLRMRRSIRSCAILAIAVSLVSCGGGGGSSGGGAVAIAPMPSPTPTPTPSPTPTPTPTPAPASTTPGPLAGGGSLGMQLEGQLACAQGVVSFNSASSAQPGWSALGTLSGPQFAEPPTVGAFTLTAVDAYSIGFDDPLIFGPANQITSETARYDQFFNGSEEFAVYRNGNPSRFDWVTLAVHAVPTQLCFLAVGVPLSSPPSTGTTPFKGFADGVVTGGAEARRLFGSLATLTFDYGAGTASVSLQLVGRGDAYGAFTQSPATAVGKVTGTGTGTAVRFRGTLRSEDGRLTGSFMGGLLGPGAANGEFAFALNDGAGLQIIGAAALAPDSGEGAWDY